MFLKDPVVNTILIYLVCKAMILSLMLAYHWLFRQKRRRRNRRRMPDPRRTAAPRLILTIKEDTRSGTAVSRHHTRTALQQTIEDTFSSN
jgi:hypothetical protein